MYIHTYIKISLFKNYILKLTYEVSLCMNEYIHIHISINID